MIASTQTNHPMGIDSTHKRRATASDSRTSIEYACAKLKEAGLRITQPRIFIINSLINRTMPASIDQIHIDLPPDSCDLVTVYRCLAVFQRIGLVRLSYFHNGASAYQMILPGHTVQPYHIIFKKDNEVRELDTESADELRAVLGRIEDRLRASGHEKVSHIAEFFVDNGPGTEYANPPRGHPRNRNAPCAIPA